MGFWLPMYLNLTLFMTLGVEAQHVHHSFRYHTSYGSHEEMRALAFSPDSRQLAVSVSDHVDLIDLQEGEIVSEYRGNPFSLGYTQDAKRLYMISTRDACLLDVQSGVVAPSRYESVMLSPGINLEERNGKLLIKSLARGSSADSSEALQPGDELLAFSEGQNGKMERITGWSLKSMTEALQGYSGTFFRLTVMPKGRFGAKNEKTLILRRTTEIATGRTKTATPPGLDSLPKALAWCMIGKRNWHEFRDAATGKAVAHLETIDIENVGRYVISPDQTRFAVVARKKEGEGNAVEVFDLATQERLAFIPLSQSSFHDIAFAADNKRVLVGTWDTIEVCDIDKGEVVSQMTLGHQLPKKDDSNRKIGSMGHLMMNSVRAGIADGSSIAGYSSRQLVARIAVSPRNVLAVGDLNGNIGMWDLESDSLVASIPAEQEEPVRHLQFSPDGRWLAYYVGGTLHLEDVSTMSAKNEASETPPSDESRNINAQGQASVVPVN